MARGNIRSVEKALEEAAAGPVRALSPPTSPKTSPPPTASCLPGQGAFVDCMNGLTSRAGVLDAMTDAVRKRGVPFLGICVGMQLLADIGLEHAETNGLGWIGGVCRPLQRIDHTIRIPHMGWNAARVTKPHPVLDALAPQAHVFFMHSFIHDPADKNDIATTRITAKPLRPPVARDNIVGVQFHPEKSQDMGLALLSKFIAWRP